MLKEFVKIGMRQGTAVMVIIVFLSMIGIDIRLGGS
jgi:hypothetical protein